MDLGLKGKKAVVTGGSKGIGYAVAAAFLAEGAAVHLIARSADGLADAARRLGAEHPGRITTAAFDLGRPEAVAAAVESAGDFDILVNNAGAIPPGGIDDVDDPTWRAAWDLKVLGYINMTRAAYRHMRDKGSGVIVNVIGIAGEATDVNYLAGTSGNAALIQFTKAIGCNSIDSGVRIVGVNPGAVATDRVMRLMRGRAEREHGDPEQWQGYMKNLPLQRPATPEEVADPIVFLASPRSGYISGTILTIDGGKTSRWGLYS